jgi:hypothetical protein
MHCQSVTTVTITNNKIISKTVPLSGGGRVVFWYYGARSTLQLLCTGMIMVECVVLLQSFGVLCTVFLDGLFAKLSTAKILNYEYLILLVPVVPGTKTCD